MRAIVNQYQHSSLLPFTHHPYTLAPAPHTLNGYPLNPFPCIMRRLKLACP